MFCAQAPFFERVFAAQGQGNALTLSASNITIEGLKVKNWGDDLTEQNTGIYSDKKIENLIIPTEEEA